MASRPHARMMRPLERTRPRLERSEGEVGSMPSGSPDFSSLAVATLAVTVLKLASERVVKTVVEHQRPRS